jgi:protein O-GlcNAc transferase
VRPGYADCHYSRGNVLRRLNRPRDSLAAYHNAHAAGAKPVLSGQLTSAQLSAALQVCEWRRSGELATELQARASDPQPLAAPFALLACCDDPAVHLACASSTMRGLTRTTQPFWRTRTGGVKLRLGYVSADIRAHAIATLIAELIERHDRNRFEVIAISYGPDDGSAMRRRLVEAFDAVHDVRTTSDHETARLISKLGIDIAIDLTGLTQHRSVISAIRARSGLTSSTTCSRTRPCSRSQNSLTGARKSSTCLTATR